MDQDKLQHTFDTVVAHMFAQGKPSMDAIQCLYNGPNGTHCGVGCLLRKDVDVAKLEGAPAQYIAVIEAIDDQYIKDKQFLMNIQTIHDAGKYMDEDLVLPYWDRMFRNLADYYKLATEVLDSFQNVVIPQPEELVHA